jgi:uncharacterized protein (TIGR02246 family)
MAKTSLIWVAESYSIPMVQHGLWPGRPNEHFRLIRRRAMSATTRQSQHNEVVLRELIAQWAKAVRDEDLAGIRADHDRNILMFDVPLPFLSRGLDAYMATWQTFFASSPKPITFTLENVEITAGNDVAFATAIGRCVNIESNGEEIRLKFRLTMGFRKQDGRWRVMHEHHSLPATD